MNNVYNNIVHGATQNIHMHAATFEMDFCIHHNLHGTPIRSNLRQATANHKHSKIKTEKDLNL